MDLFSRLFERNSFFFFLFSNALEIKYLSSLERKVMKLFAKLLVRLKAFLQRAMFSD